MLTGETPAALSVDLLAPALGASGVLLAVSGGPDSMALLELSARWRDARSGSAQPRVFAASVDHGLRDGSRGEVEMVAEFAARRGVPHTILQWSGEKPSTRLQERARAARYALLAAHARQVGANFILTAHHADDQAETILMRLVRGSAISGLAGMAPFSQRDGLTLFRPFLALRKAQLVALCVGAGVPYVHDPSNENPRFARTGARRLALMLEAEGLGPDEWARLARRAARAEAALAAATQASIAAAPDAPDGSASMDALASMPEEIAMRRLAALVLRAGASRPPRLERLESAWARLAAARSAGQALGLTLAGVCIRLDAHGRLTCAAEPPRRRGRAGDPGGAAPGRRNPFT